MLDAGCPVDCADAEMMTPLLLAADLDHADCLEFLLQRGANAYKQSIHGRTAAFAAAFQRNLLALQALCAVDVSLMQFQRRSAADYAACWSYVDCLSFVLACGGSLTMSCDKIYDNSHVLPVIRGFYSVPHFL